MLECMILLASSSSVLRFCVLYSGLGVSTDKIDELEDKLSKLEAERDELEVKVEVLTKDKDTLQEKNTESEEKIKEMESELEELKTENEELKKEIDELRHELDEADDKAAAPAPLLSLEGQDIEVRQLTVAILKPWCFGVLNFSVLI